MGVQGGSAPPPVLPRPVPFLPEPSAPLARGHLAPGAWGLRGVIQDWRYYHKQALTDQQVLELAEGGGGEGGVGPRRTCRHANEGGDSPDWTDAYGHDCAWYYDNRRSFAGICGPRLVRQFCPEACGVSKPCFEVRSV